MNDLVVQLEVESLQIQVLADFVEGLLLVLEVLILCVLSISGLCLEVTAHFGDLVVVLSLVGKELGHHSLVLLNQFDGSLL